jgi:uncharacterized protein (TIGR02246 family)
LTSIVSDNKSRVTLAGVGPSAHSHFVLQKESTMRTRFPIFGLAGLLGLCLVGSALAQNAKPAADDEATIRKEAAGYADAYGKGSFDEAGKHWAADAEYVNDEGKVTKGRDAIVSLFKKGRVATKGYSFKVDVQSVRIIKPDVAIEDGIVTFGAPDGTADKTRFSALLLKLDGKWQMTRVQDIGAVAENEDSSPYGRLKQLEWMVGKWDDEDPQLSIHMTCRWGTGKSYLIQEYAIKQPNQEPLEITQRIGWDPTNSRIRSWIFDSKGGFSEGNWQRDGNKWDVAVTGVLPDARTASARQVWTFVDENHFKWQALDRAIDSQPLADSLVTFKRAAPEQTAAAETR